MVEIANKTITIARTYGKNENTDAKADDVNSTPVIPVVYSLYCSVITITRAVIEHITAVTKKGSIKDTKPCETGSFVLTAAYAIGAEPEPASFDWIDLLILITIVPITPPATDSGTKASFIIVIKQSGIFWKLTRIIIKADKI